MYRTVTEILCFKLIKNFPINFISLSTKNKNLKSNNFQSQKYELVYTLASFDNATFSSQCFFTYWFKNHQNMLFISPTHSDERRNICTKYLKRKIYFVPFRFLLNFNATAISSKYEAGFTLAHHVSQVVFTIMTLNFIQLFIFSKLKNIIKEFIWRRWTIIKEQESVQQEM